VAFRNDNGQRRLVDNGSFIDNFEIAPLIGINRAQLLQDRAKRRKQGLQPELRMAPLEDESARAHHYLRNDSDWVNADITLVTDADQVPVAPGVVSDTTAGGRRTLVHAHRGAHPHFFSMQSGRYAVKRAWTMHKGVIADRLPPPGSTSTTCSACWTRWRRRSTCSQARSRPTSSSRRASSNSRPTPDFAQAFAGTIPYSEGIGFLTKLRARTRSTWSPTSPRTRSRTSGGGTR
jgi:ABC-2 type transport system permease protein